VTYQRVNMSAREFFQRIEKKPLDEFLYYASKVHDMGEDIANDLFPVEFLMVKGVDFNPEEAYKHRVTIVWFGPQGATTHTHYDISHNFYVQLYGEKRFLLFPPSALQNLYLFPLLHPGAQASQVDLENPDLSAFPLFENVSSANPVVAILQPGDVLYLPPMWFHHVSALTDSLSVSVWTPFKETVRMRELVASPLPFRQGWAPGKLQSAGWVYIERLLEIVLKGIEEEEGDRMFVGWEEEWEGIAQKFVEKMVLDQRYRPLYKTSPVLVGKEGTYCHIKNDYPIMGEDLTKILQAVEDNALEFPTSFSRACVWLGNIVEQVSLTVTGDPLHVAAYIEDFVRCK